MCPTHLRCNQDKAIFFYLKQYTEKVNPFQCMFLVLLEGKHADLQSCLIKPFETETRLYLNGHNSCNIPCFHNSQSENTIIKMKCCRSLWVVFIVNTNETWHLTHYVLFKDNTCFSHPTVHISSSRILSLCHRGCKVQEKKKKKDFLWKLDSALLPPMVWYPKTLMMMRRLSCPLVTQRLS